MSLEWNGKCAPIGTRNSSVRGMVYWPRMPMVMAFGSMTISPVSAAVVPGPVPPPDGSSFSLAMNASIPKITLGSGNATTSMPVALKL